MWTCSISTCWEKRFSQTPPSPSGCRPNKITGDKNFGDSASASNGCPLNVPAGELEAMQKQLDLLTELQFRRHAHRGKLGQNSADAPRAGNSRAWAGSAVPWNWWFQIFSYCATNNQICCICHPSVTMKPFSSTWAIFLNCRRKNVFRQIHCSLIERVPREEVHLVALPCHQRTS